MAIHTAGLLLRMRKEEEEEEEEFERDRRLHHIVWDERVRERVSITDRFMYDLPFFAEIFNALDARWKPKRGRGWLIEDCHSKHDLSVVYGTHSQRGLKEHFAKNPHWLPMIASEVDVDDGVLDGMAVRLHRVVRIDHPGFVRVWLDNNDTYRLSEIGQALARGRGVNEQVWALTPFHHRITLDGHSDEEDLAGTTTASSTTTTKESKQRADEKRVEDDGVLLRAAEDLRIRLVAYLQETRNLRNAMAQSPLASSELDCCAKTRLGLTLLYDELGGVEDQIENIARCQVRFCKSLGQ